MESAKSAFYVYVYIDPRSLKEFYYGKGQGDRAYTHLKANDDSEKSRLIREIQAEKLEPIIRVVAAGLSEEQAFLIETTLIWKLGQSLTNVASGKFIEHFRPQNTMHTDLIGFEYNNSIWCMNVGEPDHRNWDDARNFGFMSAGQDYNTWGKLLEKVQHSDVICAYLSGSGYVGIGVVSQRSTRVDQFLVNGQPLSKLELKQPAIWQSNAGTDDAEWVLKVDWLATRDRSKGVKKRDTKLVYGLSTLVRLHDEFTINTLQSEFGVDMKRLIHINIRKAAA